MVWFSSRLQEKEWWGGGSARHHFTTEFLVLGLCMGLCKVPLCIGIRGTLHATMDIPEKGGRMSVGWIFWGIKNNQTTQQAPSVAEIKMMNGHDL